MGAKKGGFVGGVLGLTGGAVVGVLGAAGIAVGGVFSGVVQVGRGVAAVPAQMVAPSQGKWWNDQEDRWVFTDMDKEAETLNAIPADDSDILGGIQSALDQDNKTDDNLSTEVKDTILYDALGVSPDADPCKLRETCPFGICVFVGLVRQSHSYCSFFASLSLSLSPHTHAHLHTATIKRKYYILARKLHPDKNPDNPEAAEQFKVVSEAYHILSDPEMREKYNKLGRDGLKNDPTEL